MPARGEVPERLHALPPERLGCAHLGAAARPAVEALLERYAAALRYGRRIQEGTLRPHDADDAPRAKRPRLPYPTCAVCRLELRRPFVCLECAHMACFFHDPITDAAGAAPAAGDGAEVGTSHAGLHLAEEGHAYGASRN